MWSCDTYDNSKTLQKCAFSGIELLSEMIYKSEKKTMKEGTPYMGKKNGCKFAIDIFSPQT